MFTDSCRVCHELVESDDEVSWRHSHADQSVSCGTGDGSTALPSDPAWLDRMARRYPDRDFSPYR